MSSILKRLYDLARSEFKNMSGQESELSDEFWNFFRQRTDYQHDHEFFEETRQRQYHSTEDYSGIRGYNPYKALEISPEASMAEIEKAYRKIARKYHPDRFQTSEERETATRVMAVVNASYEFLKKKHGKK